MTSEHSVRFSGWRELNLACYEAVTAALASYPVAPVSLLQKDLADHLSTIAPVSRSGDISHFARHPFQHIQEFTGHPLFWSPAKATKILSSSSSTFPCAFPEECDLLLAHLHSLPPPVHFRECRRCGAPPAVRRPRDGSFACQPCFFHLFEKEVHETIVSTAMFSRGDRVAVGASGGKDSTVLAYLIKLLNDRHGYGLDLFLLSVDEGITGYRDHSLETVNQNARDYDLPLLVVSYRDLYGWTMDDIVKEIGLKGNCTFCGVFRRQALDRGARRLGANKIITGHNADDMAETVLMNLMRGDVARLEKCANAVTTGDQAGDADPMEGALPRAKPFKFSYEKEIVLYARFKKLLYFTTECSYSPEAFRGHARTLIKDIERVRPSAILDIVLSAEGIEVGARKEGSLARQCNQCGYMASADLCKACNLLRGLNAGKAKKAIQIEGGE
jgi:cytoplasmic tRNA 2-thiolation protein 1